MPEDLSRWIIQFQGCAEGGPDCHSALFRVSPAGSQPFNIEVRVTEQIEGLLARQIGRSSLTPQEREALLSVAGRQLIEECLAREGKVGSPLLLTSEVFRRRGQERRLLRECGLL